MRRRKKPKARLWWKIHQWAGLQISLFLSFVFLTGTLAVFSYEFDWLSRPAMWVNPGEVSQPVSWGTVSAAVMAFDPEADIVSINSPINKAAAIDVVVRSPGEATPHHVYVHPGTGEVTGTGGWLGFQRFLRNTHRHLMLPVKWGVSIVAMAAVLLLVSLVTSFVVYKNWWRGFLRWPKGRTLRALVGDVHRLAGLWSMWFILLLICTGFWYLIEVWGGGAPLPDRPQVQNAGSMSNTDDVAAVLDKGIQAAQRDMPEFQVKAIIWPRKKYTAFMVQGHTGRAILVRPRVDSVWVDTGTGSVLGGIDPRSLTLHQRISEAADPLHFGTFGGYWTKTIWFVFGLALTGLSLTGVAIYSLRIAKSERATPGWRRGIRDGWRAMGKTRWVALGLCILPFVLAPILL
ncbi:hypothetical protein HY29_07800 [Hyphomonas beringensis]|uniref:Peptidase n=1 Tax=Hyphomonas beringensis TaxID=1280946 RepID=A0A062ULN5_9PROT|nr:PepSY-associated TM helix domain-containing protein [Hyphomonas beringensis]KCZ57040.1 hypothetical protein HY29_07800 [Hyphomonas beringensis]